MKIFYGINGEGLGHAMRSAEVIRELKKNHDVSVFTGGKAKDYLKKFGEVKSINYLSFITRDGKIKYIQTFLYNLLISPLILLSFLKVIISCILNRPKVIITDFEPLTAYSGLILRIPVISFDNQHIVTDTSAGKIKNLSEVSLYKLIVHLMCPFPRKKIITSFFHPKILSKNAIIVPPVVRKLVEKQKEKAGNHFLVYLSLGGDSILEVLEKSKQKCIVYGKLSRKSSKYLKIKNFSAEDFAADLASSRAVVSNAGMSTLSESIYLKKPVLCIPLSGQTEQEVNAFYVGKANFGLSSSKIDKSIIRKFVSKIPLYEKNLKKFTFSNKEVFSAIEKEIKIGHTNL
ncbi:MAG: glycosyltransferase family protein [Nanoarchaeota archaeon]